MLTAIVVCLIVYVPMLIEARRAARNERAQRARGGVEAPGDVYAFMQVAYPGAFLLMILEEATRVGPPVGWLAAGALVFAASKSLKWWAIQTLGPAWTFRVIVVPGAPLAATGPYRFLRHPNYVAVVGELIAIALLTKAQIAGPIGIIAFGLLIVKRIAVEERALGRENRQL